nr:uncharacterized protein LOC103241997 isoform X2 [Chlorocebus sabaeus]
MQEKFSTIRGKQDTIQRMALGPFLQAEGGRELWGKPEGGMPEAPRTPRSPRGQPSYRRRRRRRTTTQTHTDRPPPPRRAVCAGALTAPQAPPPSPAPPWPPRGLRRRTCPPGRSAPRSPVGCSVAACPVHRFCRCWCFPLRAPRLVSQAQCRFLHSEGSFGLRRYFAFQLRELY